MNQVTATRVPVDESDGEISRIIVQARTRPAAFRPLYVEFFPRIYRYCLRRVSVPQEAEDLTSHIFTQALTGLAGFRGGSFAAWLFRIAHNAVANHLRDRRMSIPWDETVELPVEDEMLGRLIDAEERTRLARLIATLPDSERELLALKIAGGLSAKEIGQVIGKNEGAVRVSLHRLVGQLREDWAKAEIAARCATDSPHGNEAEEVAR